MTAIRVAASRVEPDQLERELKFVMPAARGVLARSLVAAVCPRDAEYPAATLSTVYFDTPDLRFLGEKIDSDYLKAKVRLRWYAPIGAADDTARAFLEIKLRIGDRRRKLRVRTSLTAAVLRDLPFDRPEFDEVLELARPLGIALPARLLPVLLVRYDRYRFIEPMSASRVSIDMNIGAPRGSHRLVRDAAPVTLPYAVLEVKGAGTDLPRVLHPLLRLGARRGSRSKYAAAAFAMLKYAS
jgi:VTC domain-containing protein